MNAIGVIFYPTIVIASFTLRLGGLVFCCLMLWIHPLQAKDKLRYENVLYIEDYLKTKLELKVIESALLTSSRDGSGILATLSRGEKVRLVGIAGERYLVEARTKNGRAQGWFFPFNLSPIPEEILKEIETKRVESEKLEESIKKGEIEMGMTPEIVEKVLGKTKEKSIIKDANGTVEEWKYAVYKTMPFQTCAVVNGVNVYSTVYKKVVSGYKLVTFSNSKVIRYEIKQEEAPLSTPSKIIAPPIYVQ